MDEINEACTENGVDHIVLVKSDVFSKVRDKKVFFEGKERQIEDFEFVNTEDWKFRLFLNTIKIKTCIDKISYTTGPNRGEIIWQ